MSNFPKRVVESKGAPLTTDIWLDTNTNPPKLKTFINGEWVVITGGSSEDDDSGDDTPSDGITSAQAFATFCNLNHNNFEDRTQDTPLPDLYAHISGLQYYDLDQNIIIGDYRFITYHDLNDPQATITVGNYSDFSFDYIDNYLSKHSGYDCGQIAFLWKLDKLSQMNYINDIFGLELDDRNYNGKFSLIRSRGDSSYSPYLFKYNDEYYIWYVYNFDN